MKCSIPSHGIDAFKNQFHNGINFTPEESIPGALKNFKTRGLSPISTASPPQKEAAVLCDQQCCLTYPEEDADDDIRTVAGGGPADGGRQVPQEEGQPAG